MNSENIDIPFEENWTNIAISLSGGADSALLCYLLCQKKENLNIHVISHIRCWKTKPWQKYDSEVVYEWLKNRFPKINWFRHSNLVAPDIEYGKIGPTIKDEYGKMVSGDNIQIRAFSEYVCHTYNIDAYYNAVTRNPRQVDLGGMLERDIEKNEGNTHLEKMKHMDRWALHPFRFIEKSWILEQYKKLEIMDLFNLTRSCEGEFENITYKNYVPGQYVPVCNSCFWCKEREWALNQVS